MNRGSGCSMRHKHLLPDSSSSEGLPDGFIKQVWAWRYDAEGKKFYLAPIDGPVVLLDSSGRIIFSSLRNEGSRRNG